MTLPSCTLTNCLFRWKEEKKLRGSLIHLTREPFRHTRWAEALVTGPHSMLRPGDELLLSARPTTYFLNIDGETLMNTSDAATLAYRRDGVLGATCSTLLYEFIEPEEEKTDSGIVLVRRESTKELETRRARVWAAGPETGVKVGDEILIAYNKDSYAIENVIEGRKLHNAGKEAVICVWQAPV